MIPRSDNRPHVRTGTNCDTLEIRQWLIEISNNAWCTPPSRMLINDSLKFLLWNRIIDDTRIGSQIDCVAFHTVRLFRNTSNYCILLTIIPRRRRRFFSIIILPVLEKSTESCFLQENSTESDVKHTQKSPAPVRRHQMHQNSHWKFAPNISIKFASKLHFPWFASKISLLGGNSTVATRSNRSIARALTRTG